jgi:uncharacterized protein (TIGR03083 family)
MTTVGQVDGAAAMAAVKGGAARLSDLVRSIKQPDKLALGDWTVGDVAVHVSHVFNVVTAMVRGGGSLMSDVWDLGTLTRVMVKGEADRDLTTIADRIDAGAIEFRSAMDEAGNRGSRAWLVEGVEVPVTMLTCHLLNEIVMHGHDIAAAERMPWPLTRADTGLVVNGFLFPVLGALGKSMVDQDVAAKMHSCQDIRVRGGGRVYFRFDNGTLSVEDPSSAKVDCHLSVDPAGFLLVAWGRRSKWNAIARGQLMTWGVRPWHALKLREMLRNP